MTAEAVMTSSESSSCACRLCGNTLTHSFADLGMSPLANAFLAPSAAERMEPFYPLHAYVCDRCWLVQLQQFESPQHIFEDYLYFSSFSSSWLDHAALYARTAVERFQLGPNALVVEVASNDGYLLQYFRNAGIPVLGVDPAANVVETARQRGVPTECAFFGQKTAKRLREQGVSADLMVANNVLAHVPDMHDFLEGFRVLLASTGSVTFEFPHLLRLMQQNQFDTIYHEHFSYLSLLAVERAFREHGLKVYDVEEVTTHGGSLRVYACHAENESIQEMPAVARVRNAESAIGMGSIEPYLDFANRTAALKCDILEFFIDTRRSGKSVVGYGAPAKGNTLLNYCGIGREFMPFTTDKSTHKQGLLLPGTHIPIEPPEAIFAHKPDFIFILPWNLKDEIVTQLDAVRSWGAKFVVPIPQLSIL